MEARRPVIFIADFFGALKERGIPAYVRDFEGIAAEVAQVVSLRGPAWARDQPAIVQNLLMVVYEQILAPLYSLFIRPKLIVLPYNSSSFILALSRRTVCVVHDLILYKRSTRVRSPAFLYTACTARWHATLRRRFVAVSPFTARTLRAVAPFRRSEIYMIPNCFSAIRSSATPQPPSLPRRRVTLISGTGANKDFRRALELIASAGADQQLMDLTFDVVGFGPHHERASAMIGAALANGLSLPSIKVHPLLPRPALDLMLKQNAVTWAHSKAEGFGRAVVEGRLAGRPVVMSRLTVFRELRDPFTFSYRNDDAAAFIGALREALDATNAQPYHVADRLLDDARTTLKALIAG